MIYPASIFCAQRMRVIMRNDGNGREYIIPTKTLNDKNDY